MNKTDLRKKYRELRLQLPQETIEEESLLIANNSLRLPVWNKTNYHIFLPITENKEINTEYLMHILQGKDKNIIISSTDFETRSMHHFLLTDNTVIKKNAWNIPEPVGGISVLPDAIEVVFIPLLAFDEKGNRIGYGKGFYDQFLSECPKEVIKIGLSLFEAVPHINDVFETDIPLDYCITPNKTYTF
ncbi:5-formyltetrahydrofolate cyclo-ligase [Paenimyroides ceti]